MLEFLQIFGISYVLSLIVYGIILIILKLSHKSTTDIKRWLAGIFNINIADLIVELFTIILAIILYFPVKSYLYKPSPKQVKKMVVELYANSPSFLKNILKKHNKDLSAAINDIKVIYIKKVDSNTFKAYVEYNFLGFKCQGVLNINEPEWGKYIFGFDKDELKCYPISTKNLP
jgi:hypothetical protein